MTSYLFGVGSMDPLAYLTVSALLLVLAALADVSAGAARRAHPSERGIAG